ncbi:MAG: threonine aldolase family protein [Micrococcales bacterium]
MKERKIWRSFASDNYAGIHPQILEAIGAVNGGHEKAYGADPITEQFNELVRKTFGSHAEGFPTFNGTGANVLSLAVGTQRWEAVICAETAHINTDEGGAPEKVAGLKLYGIRTPDGKLTPELLDTQIYDMGFVHRAQPGVVTITQTTECGTLYSVEEIRAIADRAHHHGLPLHMDGARLSNAAAALGKSFKEFTTDAGVDLVSFGGTKIGAMGAEAVIILNDRYTNRIPFLRKSSMQLASKMRFVSAQLVALLENHGELAVANGRHANAMAKRLEAGIRELGFEIPYAVDANAVFPIMPKHVYDAVQGDFPFYVWDHTNGQVRLMCSWDTTEQDVDGLLFALRAAL